MTTIDTARDWKTIPAGYYAVPVFESVLDPETEEVIDDLEIGWVLWRREVPRVLRDGRTIGKERLTPGVVMAKPGYSVERVLAEVKGDREAERYFGLDPREELVVGRRPERWVEFRALYGRLTGRCGCCNRALTDPKSKFLGIGPDCRGFR